MNNSVKDGLISVFTSRKFWIAVGTAIADVAVALGAPSDKVTAIVTPITALAIVIIASIHHEDTTQVKADALVEAARQTRSSPVDNSSNVTVTPAPNTSTNVQTKGK